MKVFDEHFFENTQDLQEYLETHKIKRKDIQEIKYGDDQIPTMPIVLRYWAKKEKPKKIKHKKSFKKFLNSAYNFIDHFSIILMLFPFGILFVLSCIAEFGIGMAIFGVLALFFFMWTILSPAIATYENK